MLIMYIIYLFGLLIPVYTYCLPDVKILALSFFVLLCHNSRLLKQDCYTPISTRTSLLSPVELLHYDKILAGFPLFSHLSTPFRINLFVLFLCAISATPRHTLFLN